MNTTTNFTISPQQTTVGFIGIGVMGKSMAGHIMNNGYSLHVYTRTPAKAAELVQNGATLHHSPGNLAEACDVVITMVGYPHDVEEVYLQQGGMLDHAKPGTCFIDMTTSSPMLAQRIYRAAQEKNMHALDAPVSGGDIGAQNAKLSIMVGGDSAVFEAVLPLLQLMGSNIVHQGQAGAGQHTKMCNQIAIASNMLGVCEALAYAQAAGLEATKVLTSIETGAAGSWSLSNLGKRMLEGDMEPGFYIKHFVKDMGIALQAAKEMGLQTPGLELASSIYTKLIELGYGEKGTQALYTYYYDSTC